MKEIEDKNTVVFTANQPDDNTYIWRHLDFSRFIALVVESNIFMTCVTNFNDKLEGLNLQQLMDELNGQGINSVPNQTQTVDNKPDFAWQLKNEALLLYQQRHFVNCWFTGARESVAMWDLYSQPNGVAIKVRFGDFKNYILNEFNEHNNLSQILHHERVKHIYFGKVIYCDFHDPTDIKAKYDPDIPLIFYKDISFEHEKEYRIVVEHEADYFEKLSDLDYQATEYISNDRNFAREILEYAGYHFYLRNLNKMDFSLVVHPKSQDWILDSLEKLLRKHQFNCEVRFSELKGNL